MPMFQMEFDFVCEEPEIMATLESTRLQNLRFDDIAAMIADRDQPVWITSRKICGEMAATIRQLQMPVGHCQRHVAAKTKLKSRMRALRELQRTLLENEASSTRDVLDQDGCKLKFVVGEILRLTISRHRTSWCTLAICGGQARRRFDGKWRRSRTFPGVRWVMKSRCWHD